MPGIFSPQQVYNLFKAKGPSVFDKMTQDYRVLGFGDSLDEKNKNPPGIHFYLRPSIVGDTEAGGARSDHMRQGTCVHLGPSGCTLDRKTTMPLGCVVALPCSPSPKTKMDLQNVGCMWLTPKAAQVMELFENHQASTKKVGVDEALALTVRKLHCLRKINLLITKQQELSEEHERALTDEWRLLVEDNDEDALLEMGKDVHRCQQASKIALF
jgi:hypothetical protein